MMYLDESSNSTINFHEIWCQSVIDLCENFSKTLNIPSDCRKGARKIIYSLRNHTLHFSGKNRKAIAGAALYISTNIYNELLTQSEICIVAKIGIETLKLRIRDIQNIRDNFSY